MDFRNGIPYIRYMTVGERIKSARKAQAPVIGVKQLADAVGLAVSTLYDLERGEQESTTKLHAIAEFLGVRARWLETGQGPMRPEQGDLLDASFDDKYDRVTVVRGAMLSGGPGNVSWEFEEVDRHFAFRRQWLQEKGLRADRCRIYEVAGDSNAPYIRHGDVVMLDLDDRKVVDGEFYGLAFGDDLRVKQLAFRADGALRVISAAEPDKAETYRGQEIEAISIIGRVAWRGG